MFRVIKMSGNVYAMKLGDNVYDIKDDAKNIWHLAKEGNLVIICEELEELKDFGIDPAEVQVVDN